MSASMENKFQNDRLFTALKVSGGRRQFVISGEIEDYYMLNMPLGMGRLDTALKEYLKSRGFEIIVFIQSLNKPEFLTPEMEQRFQEIVRGRSVDPQATGQAARNARTFVPRARRNAEGASSPGGAGASARPASMPVASASSQNPAGGAGRAPEAPAPNGAGNAAQPSGNASAQQGNANANQTAVEVTNAGNNSEQSFLDLLTRLFNSQTKSVVVFFHPENMWMGQPTECDLRKLETILRWSTITSGHPESASILVVNPSRLKEFNTLADHRLDRENFTRNITLGCPGKRELEAMLLRFTCRYGYRGQLDKLVANAYAKQLSLYNFSELLREYVKANPETRSLDGLFADGSQAKTLSELLAEVNDLIGLTDLKAEIGKIVAEAQFDKEQRRMGRKTSPLSYHMFFLGNPGTGKTMVARLVGQIFWALEIRTSQNVVEVAYSDVISSFNEGETVANMRKKIQEAIGGVLFVDEFYLFAENEWGKKALETLMKEMEDNRDNLTVIFAGYEERLPELFKVNPGFKTRVNRVLHFADYSSAEMVQMFEMMSRKENGLQLTPEAREKLLRYIDSYAKRGGIGNGRGVRNLFEKMKGLRALRQANDTSILAEDLPDPISFKQAEAEAIIERLEKEYIGLPRVKAFFRMMFNRQRGYELRGETVSGMNNCIFLGNPGTGKTSVAREMGNLFYALGIISERNKLLEIDPISDLTSQYQGEYAQKVRDVFEEALGGVLFIDEAYQLAKDEQGRKVADQIVKMLTDPRYANMVVVMAGYPEDMRELYKINQGLARRFPHEVYFDDFKPDELKQIFYQCVERDHQEVDAEEKRLFDVRLLAILSRMANERHFGNAGAVQNFYKNQVKTHQSERLIKEPSANPHILKLCDLTGQADVKHETIDDILKELNEKFIGMAGLKEKLRLYSRNIYAEKRRAAASGRAESGLTPGKYNLRFVGNPGTGKTTIARYMARVFCSLGIIEQPVVKEYRGVDLKGSFVGQTKDVVNKIFETSAGCVVIIDEVYSLYDPYAGNQDSFGREAIDTLVGCITDPRNASTIVVLAGYKDKMDTFLTANPGLMSRFGTEIVFPDYTNEECVQILFKRFEAEGMHYPSDKAFEERLIALFAEMRAEAGENFGNARSVEGLFNRIKEKQSLRVCQMETSTDEDWLTITIEDIPSA